MKNIILKCNFLSGRWTQYAAGLTSTFCVFVGGLQWVWTSPTLPKLYASDSPMPTSHEQGSWLASILLIGALGGSLLASVTADKYGRKINILVAAGCHFGSWLLIIFATNMPILYAARLVSGAADGISDTVVPMYACEIAEIKIRGKLGAFVKTMAVSGRLFMYSVGPYLSIPSMAKLCSVFPLILILNFVWMPESPYYYLIRKENASAKNALQILRGNADVDIELKQMSDAVDKQMMNGTSWLELFTLRNNIKALIIIFGLVSANELSGNSAIAFYSELIFEKTESGVSASVSTIIYGLFQFASCLMASLLVDKLGRKPLLIISCVGSALALGAQAVYFYLLEFTDLNMKMMNLFPVVSLTIYVISFNLGISVMPFLMIGELFSANVKAKASCLMVLYISLAGFLVTKFYQTFVDHYGSFLPFAVFVSVCIASAFFVIFYIPETKGKSLEDIQNMLRGQNQ